MKLRELKEVLPEPVYLRWISSKKVILNDIFLSNELVEDYWECDVVKIVDIYGCITIYISPEIIHQTLSMSEFAQLLKDRIDMSFTDSGMIYEVHIPKKENDYE